MDTTSTGNRTATNAEQNKTILSAPGANKRLKLCYAIVYVDTAATGGTGEVALEDGSGGTSIFRADADAEGTFRIDFGKEGYPLSENTVLNLTVDSAVTTQATVTCTALGIIV